jgi:hypothetical protein
MALAYCLHHIETNNLAKITIYGEYIEKFPPDYEVEIWENTSWSCVHGVERWKSNCGCCSDQSHCGQQQWRAPLREALDWLRDKLAVCYEQKMSQYQSDPWQLRNEYISVTNDRSAQSVERFILSSIGRELDEDNKVTFLKLLEMQRNAMLMYTSCGWFFDNITGIETVQVMQYAACAMQLCQEVNKTDLVPEFKNMLQKAPSNDRQFSNGKDVYEAYVEPARIDLERVAAHFALSSIFEDSRAKPWSGSNGPSAGQEETAGRPAQRAGHDQSRLWRPAPDQAHLRRVYCYSASVNDFQRTEAGVQVLISNRTTIQSQITFEKYSIETVVLYLGDHNMFVTIRSLGPDEDFHQVRDMIDEAFRKGDNNEVVRLMNVSFNGRNYSLSHLFKDQQRRILNELLANTWDEIESSFRHIFEHNYAIMQMIQNINMPLPKALSTPAEFILNQDICRAIQAEEIDLNQLRNLADESARLSLDLDREKLRFEGGQKISQLMNRLGGEAALETALGGSPEDVKLLQTIERTVEILKLITPEMDLQNAQNVFFSIAKSRYAQIKAKAQSGDETAQKWIGLFENLAQHLGLSVP